MAGTEYLLQSVLFGGKYSHYSNCPLRPPKPTPISPPLLPTVNSIPPHFPWALQCKGLQKCVQRSVQECRRTRSPVRSSDSRRNGSEEHCNVGIPLSEISSRLFGVRLATNRQCSERIKTGLEAPLETSDFVTSAFVPEPSGTRLGLVDGPVPSVHLGSKIPKVPSCAFVLCWARKPPR